MSNIYKQLGVTIRKYRKDKNLSAQELAGKLSISVGHISNIENGAYDIFKLELLTKIAEQLNVPLKDLLTQSFINTDNMTIKEKIQKHTRNHVQNSNIKPEIIERHLDILIMSYLATISQFNNSSKLSSITDHLLDELKFIRNLNAVEDENTTAL